MAHESSSDESEHYLSWDRRELIRHLNLAIEQFHACKRITMKPKSQLGSYMSATELLILMAEAVKRDAETRPGEKQKV